MKPSIKLLAFAFWVLHTPLHAFEVTTPTQSPFHVQRRSSNDFQQLFRGTAQLSGRFSVEWLPIANEESAAPSKALRLAVRLWPDEASTALLPVVPGREMPKVIWIQRPQSAAAMLLPKAQYQKLVQHRKGTAHGHATLVLSQLQIEFTCDQISYGAHLERARRVMAHREFATPTEPSCGK